MSRREIKKKFVQDGRKRENENNGSPSPVRFPSLAHPDIFPKHVEEAITTAKTKFKQLTKQFW